MFAKHESIALNERISPGGPGSYETLPEPRTITSPSRISTSIGRSFLPGQWARDALATVYFINRAV